MEPDNDNHDERAISEFLECARQRREMGIETAVPADLRHTAIEQAIALARRTTATTKRATAAITTPHLV